MERAGGRPGLEGVLVGMNPGPFGMAQTGIPFGDVASVASWMAISGAVGQPSNPHPARPVAGFQCKRSEVGSSGLGHPELNIQN